MSWLILRTSCRRCVTIGWFVLKFLGTIFVEVDMFSSAHFGSLHTDVLLAFCMMLESNKCLSG